MKCPVCGAENETSALYCSECGEKLPDGTAADTSKETYEPKSEVQWYYVNNGNSVGPFAQADMITMIQGRTLNGTTYVWKTGMAEWQRLQDTELASYIPAEKARPDVSDSEPQVRTTSSQIPLSVKSQSVVLYLILSFVTCGIWQWYWIYQLAKDVNSLADAQKQPAGCDPLTALLLSIVTCNVYTIYFFWKEGKTISRLHYPAYEPGDDSTILAVLAIFVPIVSMCILQSTVNDIVKYGE